MYLDRRTFLAVAGGAALAGCAEETSPDPDARDDPESENEDTPTQTAAETSTPTRAAEVSTQTTAVETSTPTTATDTPTATQDTLTATATPTESGGSSTESGQPPPTREGRLPLPMEGSELRSETTYGGVPKDGIPSVDDPRFVDAETASETLADGDVVFGLARNGAVRAYPRRILAQHEICNDTVGGENVSVTYCPLTGTAMGFARGETTFGVSGLLINNNLVMYDRGTEAWWPQMLATSIPGAWNESPGSASLTEFRIVWTTWERWRVLHPDTEVLSEDTGYIRNYDNDPYGTYNPKGGYYSSSDTTFPILNSDDTFEKKRVVLGTRTPDGAAAFLKDALRDQGTIRGEIGDEPLIAVYDARLDTGYVYRNPEGADVTVDGEEASVDGSTHSPDALPLERVYAYGAMWFAWHGFYPETNVYE